MLDGSSPKSRERMIVVLVVVVTYMYWKWCSAQWESHFSLGLCYSSRLKYCGPTRAVCECVCVWRESE